MVPPVPAPAMKTSTLPEEGLDWVEGVETTAAMISGPVVSSWASGLFTCSSVRTRSSQRSQEFTYVRVLVQDHSMRNLPLQLLRDT